MKEKIRILQDIDGLTPLHYAVRNQNQEILEVLCSAKIGNFHNPVKDPEEKGINLVTELNRGNNMGFTPVHYACIEGNKEMLLYLLNLGGKIDLSSVQGVNCFHLACRHSRFEMAKFLIEDFDFNPETPTENQRRPIHLTAQGGSIKLMRYLIEDLKV